jgi:hypothetical protein
MFGKRGSGVVEANLAVVAASYDGVIDVTAALGSLHRPGGRRPELATTETTPLLEEALP